MPYYYSQVSRANAQGIILTGIVGDPTIRMTLATPQSAGDGDPAANWYMADGRHGSGTSYMLFLSDGGQGNTGVTFVTLDGSPTDTSGLIGAPADSEIQWTMSDVQGSLTLFCKESLDENADALGIYELEVDDDNGTHIFDIAGTSTGANIPDSLGSITATINNAPGDDSQWVLYGEPSVTLDNATQTPGSTINGSYANFSGVPTSPLVLTDSGSNTLNVTVTITDNGDGTGTFTGTMPTLPAQGASATGLLFGSVTAELIDPDTTAPVLTTATVTSPSAGQIDGTVDTDEADGTLYYVATLNATETLATVKAGASQAVIATGTQSVSVTGLAAGTYYMHFAHTDQAGNDSAVLTSASVVVA